MIPSFDTHPFIVIWEMTRACALRCLHCRAEAIDQRHPFELNTEEAKDLLAEIRRFGPVLTVLTGGDPMRRPDALDLVKYGADLGLRMSMTPSATSEMSFEKVLALKERGLARLAVSLDGSNARIHDRFRGVPGSFGWTLDIIRWAKQAGLPVQINTTFTRYNLEDFEALASLMKNLGIVLWSVFILVPVGRGQIDDMLSAEELERLFERLADLSMEVDFDIKSTEAPHYRRVVLQRSKGKKRIIPGVGSDGIGRASAGVNDGCGFAFVSHTGAIYPSGFLPIVAGNVRKDSLVDVYRNSEIFRALRDKTRLGGKCGLCEYKMVCGGSRARSYATTGDMLAAEPYCAYLPAKAEALSS